MPEFVCDTISRIKTMNSADLEKIFEQVKEKLLQDWANTYLLPTYKQVSAYFDTLLISNSHEKKVLIDGLAKFTYQEFVAMRNEWLASGNMLWFMAGNLQQEVAVKTLDIVRSTL